MNYAEVIAYWYSSGVREHWFSSTAELDREILERFESTWERAVRGELNGWRTTAMGSLALVIVFDQFPLNMFRGEARSFQTEGDAIDVARAAIENDFASKLSKEQRSFLFMPFMHSERLEDQDLAVALYRENGMESNLRFAEHHRGIIRQFGRFPHRNRILGRESTPAELAYLNSREAFKG